MAFAVCSFRNVLIVLVIWSAVSSELLDDDYEVIDGIKVSRESLDLELKRRADQLRSKHDKERAKSKSEEPMGEENDDDDDEDGDVDDDDDDDVDEDLEATKHLPTKCHVCRLLAVEVENKLAKVGRVRKTRENKSPIYYKEELAMPRVMEDLCDNMLKYNIRTKHPFRYTRGVKSLYRKQLEEATKDSRIQKWIWATPVADIDDPTGEIRRLKTQCHEMLAGSQHDLMHWFMKAQSRDLTKWLCAKRVLLDDDQECLKIEMPKRNRVRRRKARKPLIEGNKRDDDTGHEEL